MQEKIPLQRRLWSTGTACQILWEPLFSNTQAVVCVLLYRVTQKHALLLSVESENVFISYFALSKLNFHFSYL